MQALTKEEIKELVKLRKTALANLNVNVSSQFSKELEKNLSFAKLFITKEFLREIFSLDKNTVLKIAQQYDIPVSDIPTIYLQNRNKSYVLGLLTEKEQIDEEYKSIKEEERKQKKQSLIKVAVAEDVNLEYELPESVKMVKKPLTEQEIEELKLAAITATQRQERIKLLRKCMYLSIPNKDKIYILTRALSEDDPKVKLESIGFLRYFGIRPQIAEIFKELVSSRELEKKLALQTLVNYVDKLEHLEKTVLIILLLSFLKFEESPKLLISAFEIVEKVAGKITTNLEWSIALVRIVIEKLSEDFHIFNDTAYKLLKKLFYLAGTELQNVLYNELDTIPAKNIRGIFLEVFSNSQNLTEKISVNLPEKIFNELRDWDEVKFECRKLGYCFSKFGFPSLVIMTKNFDSIPQVQRQFFIRLLSPTFKALPADEKTKNFLRNKFYKFLSRLIQKSNKQEIITILEEDILLNVPLPDELKIKLSIAILLRAGEFLYDRLTELVIILFSKLNVNIANILLKIYIDNFDINIKKIILRILINTKTRYNYEKDKKIMDKFLRTLESDYGLYDDLKEIILSSMGAIHSIKNIDERKIGEFAAFLKTELPKSKVPWAVIESLSILFTGDSVPLNLIIDIANLLISILNTPVPNIKTEQLQTKETTVYKIYGSIRIFTDLIPATILGLEKIALNSKTPDTIRFNIFNNLIEKYYALTNVKEIWGPSSVTTLVKTIKNIVTSSYFHTSHKLQTLKVFSNSPLTITVCETVIEILTTAQINEAFENYIEYYVNKILAELEKLKIAGDFDSVYYILRYIIKLLKRSNLSADRKKDLYLKEKIVSALIRLYNENGTLVYGILAEVAKIETLPPNVLRTIRLKLKP